MSQNLLWVDKYKPNKIPDIIGNKSNVQKIINWLRDWFNIHVYHKKEKPKFVKFGDNLGAKAILLSGPPGIGKTSMAHIIANDLGFDIQEMNSSDDRTKSIVEKEVKETNSINTMFKYFGNGNNNNNTKKHKVIIMDEVDGLSSSDRGGITALIESIKNTKTPIICICNDRHKPALKSLINHCFDIKISRPDKREIMKRIWFIMNEENMNIDLQIVEKMIESSGNDLRNVINNLQFMNFNLNCENNQNNIQNNNKKDDLSNISIFESSRMILSHNIDFQTKYNLYFNDYDMTPLFIHENYIKTLNSNTSSKNDLEKLNKLALSSEILSDFDFIDSHSSKNNGVKDWNILPINAGLIASVGNLANGPCGFPDFPQYLGKNSTKRKRDRYLNEMTKNRVLKSKNRNTEKEYRLDYIPLLQTKITQPLINTSKIDISKTQEKEKIKNFIEVLDENGIDKEDIVEKVSELYLGDINKEYKYENIDSKLKSSLTREWNKHHQKSIIVSKKNKSTINNLEEDIESNSDIDIEDNEIDNNEELIIDN